MKEGAIARKEVYISVDIESSGSIPGEYSLLSLGACVVEDPTQTFYIEFKPLNDNFEAQALEVCGLSLEELKERGTEPPQAMEKFEHWVRSVCGDGRPVFVAFNATFDWMFTHWYFMRFLGRNPFGISGLDIKAYYMGITGTSWGRTTKKDVRKRFPVSRPHTHNALDDALEQAEMFSLMLRRL
ncbi:MAG: 3'-5' exonuclease [Armatimonadetes bacterium]|nr:3'-5' exonuclease [Armatimonadota bacterium]